MQIVGAVAAVGLGLLFAVYVLGAEAVFGTFGDAQRMAFGR
jgi:hypothetical protein